MNSNDLEKIRQEVVEAGLALSRSSITIGTYGNISQRVDEKYIAITPSGRDYEQLTAADIVVTDLDGAAQKIETSGAVQKTEALGAVQKSSASNADQGNLEKGNDEPASVPLRPSSELPLHLEIYKNFPEARAIVHTHSVYASALAVAHKDLPPVTEELAQVVGGAVRCTDYTIAGTKELGLQAVKAMEGGRNAALLANHGTVCWGRDLKEALSTAQIVEKAAKIYCITHSFGSAFKLDDQTVETLHGFYLNHYSKRQRGEE